eukprot:SM000167S02980  [mRNA]  locus=s167:272820:275057:- [translate_table: standard]
MLALFLHELSYYLHTYTVHEMGVDQTGRGTKLDINVDITFPSLPCQVLSLDALDASGKHETRLRSDGSAITSEVVTDLVEYNHAAEVATPGAHGHGAGRVGHNHGQGHDAHQDQHQHKFFHTAEDTQQAIVDIKAAMEAREGCHVSGYLSVQRVAGNFHVSVHGSSLFILNSVFGSPGEINVSHTIQRVSFGHEYPGLVNPLDGFVRMLNGSKGYDAGSFKYFLKVVPTQYRSLSGTSIDTNQYSVTEYFSPQKKHDSTLPAVYFVYDLSPVTVSITERRRNLLHFITRLCAVLGGTFAFSGMLDRWLHKVLQVSSKHSRKGQMQ